MRFSPMLLKLTLAVVLAGSSMVPVADAKVGGGGSMGSRGGKTFSAPPSTTTAPRGAQPFQRTEAPAMAPRPASGATTGRFGGGFAAGLLGAGLLGLVLGHGFAGGLSGLTSLLGFLLQAALLAGLVWVVLRWFRARNEPALASGPTLARSPLGSAAGGGTGAPPRMPLAIGPADYAAFERLLGDTQAAYAREDLSALSRLATPEMVRYFAADLDENRRRGLRNEISDVRLLQGDLAEAWREGGTDYASVAMRFSMIDVTVERASGRAVEGRRDVPAQCVEVWTFRRDGGGSWMLCAIQQSA